ncbi:MAG: hypothetical protein GY714_19165 [Desulfobacterales bacterium]|nr:hypothetical protein [Desulfobacterales bacterium]MCP4159770.1 hypothetical protein [Deltaproteobacteria bacterium]
MNNVKKNLIIVFLFLSSTMILTGCFTTNTFKKDLSFNLYANSEVDVQKAIRQGCADRGWNLKVGEGSEYEALLIVRSHEVRVKISYTNETLKFTYISSKNMKYNGKIIHKKYNMWLEKLYASINQALARNSSK